MAEKEKHSIMEGQAEYGAKIDQIISGFTYGDNNDGE